MKNRARKPKTNFVARITAAVFLPAFLPFASLAFWRSANGTGGFSTAEIEISDWIVNPDISRLNERVTQLINADALLAWSQNALYILGDKTDTRTLTPTLPVGFLSGTALKAGTVLIWQSTADSVIAVQLVKDITYEEYKDWFSSWEALESAAKTNSVLLGGIDNAGFTRYSSGRVYTTAHGPVAHNGNYYLARHNNVTGIPSPAGNADWFLISASYVPQDYPAGAFTEHGGRHFRKVSAYENAEPGKNCAGWKALENYAPLYANDIPVWRADGLWKLNNTVKHLGNYYICILDGTQAEPGDSALPLVWEQIPLYDESNLTVPLWDNNADYEINDTVIYENDYYIALRNIGGGTLPNTSGAWHKVIQHLPENAPPAYLAGSGYEPDAFVRYTDSNGITGFFISPSGGNNALPGDKNGPWLPVPSWGAATSGVEDWSKDRQYIDSDLGMFVYYGGEIYRFEGKNPPKGKTPDSQSNSWTRIPKWSEIDGVWRGEQTICTLINDTYVIWQLNTNKSFSLNNRPHAPVVSDSGNDDWIQYEKACTSPYVYTEYGGRKVLWYSGAPSNAPPGSFDSPWQNIDYKTGHKYVYTTNDAGVIRVWYSENETSVPPGANLQGWTELYSNLGETYFPVFYLVKDGIAQYYETLISDAEGNIQAYLPNCGYESRAAVLWNKSAQAWVGGNLFAANYNCVAYHWNSRNIYRPGDIVVYGLTLTNTYSYFRLRADANPFEATGREPASASGYIYWEPLNVIGLS